MECRRACCRSSGGWTKEVSRYRLGARRSCLRTGASWIAIPKRSWVKEPLARTRAAKGQRERLGGGGKRWGLWTPLRPDESTRIEKRILGIMLQEPTLIPTIEGVLGRDSSVFARYGHAEVYRSMLDL